ncbi:MAG: polysaccharide biosynthesis protein [Clostridia bacterium]|nr:polysaccharide biosynthesis protein [Clostridia bacterium]
MKNKTVNLRNRILWMAVDTLIILIAALCTGLCTMWDRSVSVPDLIYWTSGNIIITLLMFTVFGLYSVLFKSFGMIEILKTVVAIACVGVYNIVMYFILRSDAMPELYHIPHGATFVFMLFLCFFTVFARGIKRLVTFAEHYLKNETIKTRVIVIGAGDAGTSLIKEMLASDKISYRPVCILDDNEDKTGKSISSVKIVGTTDEVKKFVTKYNADEIFIAIPSATNKRKSEIVNKCKDCGVPVKILPGIYQLASGEVTVAKLRKVDVQDLLGREQVKINLEEVIGYIENKVVFVSGGGGSIGSELCRQIAHKNPKQLIIFDIYENNAYEIEQELKRKYPNLNLLALIGSIRDKKKVEDVFDKYRPQIVFHAAAHKHVPLMETSPNEAVKNNVFGTLNLAKMADKYKVETFVQISTDKAVNPTNIMGATKRICEMIIQTVGKNSKNTKFVAVRFGNVLGSNGSVIPLFKKQIAEGGPVTVTHKDIIRYFMTIPEAVSLVLQAGAYAKGGEIFVLDMGDPVKIYDLAYNLIKLSGYQPNVDIDIVCTGLRPGEKLYEERLMEEEGLKTTPNGQISIAKPISLDEEKFFDTLDKLYEKAYLETDEMKQLVKELVPTYTIDNRKDK